MQCTRMYVFLIFVHLVELIKIKFIIKVINFVTHQHHTRSSPYICRIEWVPGGKHHLHLSARTLPRFNEIVLNFLVGGNNK